MAYCSKCGTSIQEGGKFCPGCGSPVGSNATPPQAAPSQPQPQTTVVNNYNVPAAAPTYTQSAPNTAYASGEGAPVAVPPAITTNRGVIMYAILFICTCGIYGYYYVYSLAKDVNRMCKADGDKIGGLAAYILLSFVTCGFYSFYWQYKIANRLQANAPLYGLNFPEGGTTVLMWDVFGLLICGLGSFVGMHIVLKNTNAMAAAYNARIGR